MESSLQAGRVTADLTTVVVSVSGWRMGVTAQVRRLDGRGGAARGSVESRRVPNLVLEGVGPLRTPFWTGMICRGLVVTGFWKVILSDPQYEKVFLLLRSESSELSAPSSPS